MVYAAIHHWKRYAALSPAIEKALVFLAETNLPAMEDGRYEIDGSHIFALISSRTTQPFNGQLECHTKYLDLQYAFAGRELVHVAFADGTQPLVEENPQQDFALYKDNGLPLLLGNGQFLLLWPEDLHAPLVQVDTPEPVRKVVVKIELDYC